MAADRVQSGTNVTSSGSSLSVTLTGVTAGNTLIVLIGSDSGDATTKTFSATDNVNAGNYTVKGHNYANSNRIAAALCKENVGGGDTQVTVTLSAGTEAFCMTVVEVSGAGASPSVTYAEFDNTSSTNPKYATPSTGFSPTDGSLVLAMFTYNGTTGGNTAGSGYTAMYDQTASSVAGFSQYRALTTGITNHQPEMSITTATRQGPACAVWIAAATAAFRPAWAARASAIIGGGA